MKNRLLVAWVFLGLTVSVGAATLADGSGGLRELLDAGAPVLGVFSGPKTPEQAADLAELADADFVFYSLERGPFDLETFDAFEKGLRTSGGEVSHPVMLRVPPLQNAREASKERIQSALAHGVAGIVVPHIKSSLEAAFSVAEITGGDRPINFLLLEDDIAIKKVREIVSTPGVDIVSPGPGDLREVYDGDMEKVEWAIQEVLKACKEFHVPCGVTAGAADIQKRLEQGFQVIIATENDALAVARAALK